jgi:transcription elongation factor GreB
MRSTMSKAFTKESDGDGDDELPEGGVVLPLGAKNYMTPAGYERLRDELKQLLEVVRPDMVRTVSWAAANGDRSENGDYLYGKKRLREIDRRVRYLAKRIESAEVVDSARQMQRDQVFFGATVTYENGRGEERTVTIVGADEVDLDRGRVSWLSPIAKALTRARVGDSISMRVPGGVDMLEVIKIQYLTIV